MRYARTRRRRTAAMILTALLAGGAATAAWAHPDVAKWWQYDKATWRHSWRDDPALATNHQRWHNRHTYAARYQDRDEHELLREQYLAKHFHRAISFQEGQATWYDGRGLRGACGKPLVGMYAASRTLPCGALVSVRAGGRYVLVRILDRGPFGSSSRILDLSPKAFHWLAPLGAGVIWVKAVQLRG